MIGKAGAMLGGMGWRRAEVDVNSDDEVVEVCCMCERTSGAILGTFAMICGPRATKLKGD